MSVVETTYVTPSSMGEALELLSRGRWTVLAGGTDIYPACSTRLLEGPVLDLSAIGELRGISRHAQGWRIGGLTTWTDIARAELPGAFDALKQAAFQIGALQIQNVGTIAGNLCNASPAADGVPPLLCLDGAVELVSRSGKRTLPLGDFITGNRSTRLHKDELLSALILPGVSENATSRFYKLGSRRYQIISIAMVAVLISRDANDAVDRARVAVGACSEVAQRLYDLEQVLIGKTSEKLSDLVSIKHMEVLNPIDDVRSSAGFRRHAALEMIRRALDDCQGIAS